MTPSRSPPRSSSDGVAVLVQKPGSVVLTLMHVALDGSVRQAALPVEGAGLWAAIATSEDGQTWIGAQDKLLRIDAAGSQSVFALPAPAYPLTGPVAGPSSPMGPIETGQITALAALDGAVYVGRAGQAELTRFDVSSRSFDQIALPGGTGDVASLVVSGPHQLAFTVNRSGTVPGRLNDVLGFVDTRTGAIAAVPRPARAIAANGSELAVSSAGVGLFDSSGRALRDETRGTFDLSSLALTQTGVTKLRASGTHEIVSLDRSGRELARQVYRVPILPRRTGVVPYTARWAFALVDRAGALWFAAQGRPEIYRVQ